MKFHYLTASLEGDILKVIQSIDFSERNYNVAWDFYVTINSRLLVFSHMKSLFNLDPFQKESAIGLKNLIDNVYKNLR